MKRMKLQACIFIILTILMSAVYAEKIPLRCGDSRVDVFILDTETMTARLVSEDDAPSGSLRIEDHQYLMTFPSTQKRTEARVKINRYTGKYEFDTKPQSADPMDYIRPSYNAGSCEKVKSTVRY